MVDFVILGILAVLAGIAVYSTVKHFQGKSGCCGGGGYRTKKKKLCNIQYQKVFLVEGMHCDHCKNRVEEVINDMKGVAGRVNLKKGELTVSYAEQVEDALIKTRIEKAGYTVTGIKEEIQG